MKNRKLLLIVSLALAMMMSLGGTLAYLTDTDGDVNVMVVGNVKIEQNEYQRVDQTKAYSEIEEFEQAKTMLPYVDGTGETYAEQTVDGWRFPIRNENKVKNYVDKIVNVTNTGASDAYVRTLIAIPEVADFDAKIESADLWLHWNVLDDAWDDTYNGYGWYWGKEEDHGSWPADEDWNFYNNVTIDNQVYDVFVGTNVDALAKGATTAPSLVGIYLDKKVDCDVNDDGTLNYTWTDKAGKEYNLGDISQLKVLTLTQAVQADGFDSAWAAFDAAFPIPADADEAKTELAGWFKDLKVPTMVSTAAELTAALANGGTVVLSDGFDVTGKNLVLTKSATINLNGQKLTNNPEGTPSSIAAAAVITADGEGVVLELDGEGTLESYYCVAAKNGAKIIIKGGTYNALSVAAYANSGEIVIEGGHFEIPEPIEDGYEYLLNCKDDKGGKIVVKGGTFVGFNPENNASEGAGTNYVPDGYKVVADETKNPVWYTVVPE